MVKIINTKNIGKMAKATNDLSELLEAVQLSPGTIELDELMASKLFLKYSNEIQAWISSSPRGDVLRAILGRQGSVVDKESLELLKTLVESERDDEGVTTDSAMVTEIIGLLDGLIAKLN